MNELIKEILDTKDTTDAYAPEDIEQNKGLCIATSIPILFWLPLVAAKDSRFARYYANQSLILLVCSIILSAVCMVLGIIPLIGGPVSWILGRVVNLAELLLFVVLVVNASNGKAKELPFIGGLMQVFK